MQILAQIGGASFTLVCLVIGLRLIVLASKRRHLPEFLVGTSLAGLAGIGYPLSAIARQVPGLGDPTRIVLSVFAALLCSFALTCNSAFTWQLFRRERLWAEILVALTGIACGLLVITQMFIGNWAGGGDFFWDWLPLAISFSFGWGCWEPWSYYKRMRRRLVLGLADPLVADRIRLYAVAMGLGVVTNLIGWVYRLYDIEMINDPLGGPILAVLAGSAGVAMWLAFLPPRIYRERVLRRYAVRPA